MLAQVTGAGLQKILPNRLWQKLAGVQGEAGALDTPIVFVLGFLYICHQCDNNLPGKAFDPLDWPKN